jgi:putative DNA primase/helicase
MTRLATITAAEVTPQRAAFAWEARVPLGELSILAGAPGLGKTQLAQGACARATRGKLPGDFDGPVDVLYISAEDSREHTLVPRFLAAGGDPRRAHFFEAKERSTRNGDERETSLLLPHDVPLMDEWLLNHPAARIVVLDPIVAFIPEALNAHRDQHVRRVLAPLAHMADQRQIAVLAIMHLNKNAEAGALNRLSGSIGFGAAARSVLLFGHDPDDPRGETGNQRVLAHAKCNVGPLASSIAYRIESRVIDTPNGAIETSVAMRHGDASASAGDLLGNAASGTEATARGEAGAFLLAELADGPVAVRELHKRADDAGLTWRTVERAKQQLGIRARKTGAKWSWEPPIPNTPCRSWWCCRS